MPLCQRCQKEADNTSEALGDSSGKESDKQTCDRCGAKL
jgi:DNA-directed RNA polymerase subunit RPC12/RpoP